MSTGEYADPAAGEKTPLRSEGVLEHKGGASETPAPTSSEPIVAIRERLARIVNYQLERMENGEIDQLSDQHNSMLQQLDPEGNSREWECAFRTTRRSECDGVAIVVFARYPVTGKEDEVLLISQYRPPVEAEVIECPAGLVDAGEDATKAAVRELLEETGFSGKVVGVSPILSCDPGMTNANMRVVTVEVNGDSEENRNAKARPEEGEFITLRRLPAKSLQSGLDKFAASGFQIDARLYAMALGYTLGASATAAGGGGGGSGTGDCSRRGVLGGRGLGALFAPSAVVVAGVAAAAAGVLLVLAKAKR